MLAFLLRYISSRFFLCRILKMILVTVDRVQDKRAWRQVCFLWLWTYQIMIMSSAISRFPYCSCVTRFLKGWKQMILWSSLMLRWMAGLVSLHCIITFMSHFDDFLVSAMSLLESIANHLLLMERKFNLSSKDLFISAASPWWFHKFEYYCLFTSNILGVKCKQICILSYNLYS